VKGPEKIDDLLKRPSERPFIGALISRTDGSIQEPLFFAGL